MVRVTDVSYGPLRLGSTYKVEDDVFEEFSRRYSPSVGDIVITRVGSYGKTAFVTDPDFCLGQNTAAIVPKMNSRYLYLTLNSKQLQQQIESSVVGSTQKTLSLKAISNLEIPRSTPEVEDFIAQACGQLDDKIELNHKINQTLEQMAQAIFKSWFVDFVPIKAKIAARQRWLALQPTAESASPVCYADEADPLPDLETYMTLAAMQAVSGKDEEQLACLKVQQPEQYAELRVTAELFPSAMQDSELGEIPEGWQCLPLDELAKYQNGLALQKFRPENEDDYLPVVKISQLKKGYADGEEKASPNIKPCCIIDNGDVIFSWSGSLMVDTWCGGKAALNQHLFKVTSELYPKWLYFHFTRHHLEEFQRIAADKAVTMGHIKREHLQRALCAVPKAAIIEGAGKSLGNILDKQIELRLESTTLFNLRDMLLPKLLAGEIYVTGPTFQVAEVEGIADV